MSATTDTIPAAVRLAEWKAEVRRLKASADSAAAELARINRELDRAQAYVRDYAQLSATGQLPAAATQTQL